MKDTFDDFCRLFSLFGTFGLGLITLRSWLLAYLCGVQDLCNYSVLITINEFNEAVPELILWMILLPIFVYGLYLNSKILWNWHKIKLIEPYAK